MYLMTSLGAESESRASSQWDSLASEWLHITSLSRAQRRGGHDPLTGQLPGISRFDKSSACRRDQLAQCRHLYSSIIFKACRHNQGNRHSQPRVLTR